MVNASLFTALSGLRSHQQFIDVIGNNIANVNTSGFWGSRTTFSDLISFSMSGGTGAYGNRGGTNPMQIGLGTQVSSIDMNTKQGTFLDTGRPLDVAIQGKGFFVLNDGDRDYYTRVGTFGVDTARKLVDVRTGMRVLGQNDATIDVPVTDTIPAQATSTLTLEGNLPAVVTGPLAEVLTSSTTFQEGVAATVPPSSTSSFGSTGPFDVTASNGDAFTIFINGKSGQKITLDSTDTSFANPAAATAAEMVTFINKSLSNATASLNASGEVSISTNLVGDATSIRLENTTGTPLDSTFLNLPTQIQTGSQVGADTATLLNDLVCNQTDYIAGDSIRVSGRNADGTAIGNTFIFGTGVGQDGTTLGDMVTFLNTQYQDASVSIDTNGNLVVTADSVGEGDIQLFLSNATGTTSTGSSTFPAFQITQNGAGNDTVTTAIDIFDSLGRSHPVSLTLERNAAPAENTWTLTASVPSTHGTMITGADTVTNITFNENGAWTQADSESVTFNWGDLPQQEVFFGKMILDESSGASVQSRTYSGLTMLGDKASAAATNQNGYTAGELLNVSFESSGSLTGFYSNGQTQSLATLQIALFGNEGGLKKEGETYFTQSPNSDTPTVQTAGSGGAGTVVAGALENSNVDIAEEFVRLIEAQRGFQANARVISTADQILAELVNLVR